MTILQNKYRTSNQVFSSMFGILQKIHFKRTTPDFFNCCSFEGPKIYKQLMNRFFTLTNILLAKLRTRKPLAVLVYYTFVH